MGLDSSRQVKILRKTTKFLNKLFRHVSTETSVIFECGVKLVNIQNVESEFVISRQNANYYEW